MQEVKRGRMRGDGMEGNVPEEDAVGKGVSGLKGCGGGGSHIVFVAR